MAFVHGKGSVFKLDNGAGSLQDLSAYVNSLEYNFPTALGEVTAFGASYDSSIVGLKSGTFTVSGPWDATLDAHMNGIDDGLSAGGSVSYELHPAGTASGTPKYTGECYLTSYSTTSNVADVITWTAEFKTTSTITRGTN